jgi:arylsulfatase A-like enzyme
MGIKTIFPMILKNTTVRMLFIRILHLNFWTKENKTSLFFFLCPIGHHTLLKAPIRDTLSYAKTDWPKAEQAQAAKVTLQDKQVGRLLDKLASIGELDNTIVLYTSDNGAHFAADGNGHDLEFFNSNGNLKRWEARFV